MLNHRHIPNTITTNNGTTTVNTSNDGGPQALAEFTQPVLLVESYYNDTITAGAGQTVTFADEAAWGQSNVLNLVGQDTTTLGIGLLNYPFDGAYNGPVIDDTTVNITGGDNILNFAPNGNYNVAGETCGSDTINAMAGSYGTVMTLSVGNYVVNLNGAGDDQVKLMWNPGAWQVKNSAIITMTGYNDTVTASENETTTINCDDTGIGNNLWFAAAQFSFTHINLDGTTGTGYTVENFIAGDDFFNIGTQTMLSDVILGGNSFMTFSDGEDMLIKGYTGPAAPVFWTGPHG